MTSPSNRHTQRKQVPQPVRPVYERYGNRNATKHPSRWAVYEATTVLYGLLMAGPLPCKEALARMRQHGYGINRVFEAAALIGVPVGYLGFSHQWRLPDPAPQLNTVLARLVAGGRLEGRRARKHRQQLFCPLEDRPGGGVDSKV